MGWVEHQYDIYTYGEDQMKIDSAALEVENPLQVNPQAVTVFAPWVWDLDGIQIEIPNTFTVETETTLPDQTQENQQTHLSLYLDEQGMPKLGWFTYCNALEGD